MYFGRVLRKDRRGFFGFLGNEPEQAFQTVLIHPFYETDLPKSYQSALEQILETENPILILEPGKTLRKTAQKLKKPGNSPRFWFARTSSSGIYLKDMTWESLCKTLPRPPKTVQLGGMYFFGNEHSHSGCVGSAMDEMRRHGVEARIIPYATHR